MKLLDVLAKEMKGWPEGGYSVGQAADGTLHVNGKRGILLYHTKKAYSQPSAGKFYADVVTKDMWENSRVKSKTINSLQSKHKHAEMIALCAEFAQTMENPMLMFQFKDCGVWVDFDIDSNLAFYNHREYRLKPKTRTVNGVEIPNISFTPSVGEMYYYPNPILYKWVTDVLYREDCKFTGRLIELNLCYPFTDEGKQAAIAHSKAMLGIA